MGTEAVEISRLTKGEAENSHRKQTDQVPAEGFNGRCENSVSVGCDENLGKVSDNVEAKMCPDSVCVSWTKSCVNEIFASISCSFWNMLWVYIWQYHLAAEKCQAAEGSDLSGYVSKRRYVWWGWRRRQWLGSLTEEFGGHEVVLHELHDG